MKHLSIFIRSAVLATAMLLVPAAASAWTYCQVIRTDNTVVYTTEFSDESSNEVKTMYFDLTELSADSCFSFYFKLYNTDESYTYVCPDSWGDGTYFALANDYGIKSEESDYTTSLPSRYFYIEDGAGKYVTLTMKFYSDSGINLTTSDTGTSDETYVSVPWHKTYVVSKAGSKICANNESYNIQDGAWANVTDGDNTYNNQFLYSYNSGCLTYTILMDSVDQTNGLDFYIDLRGQSLLDSSAGTVANIYASSSTGENVANYLWSSSSSGAYAVASSSAGSYFHIDYNANIAFYTILVWPNSTSPWVSVRAGYKYYLIPSSASDLSSGYIAMSPARLRNGGAYSTQNWMVHLQDFIINKLGDFWLSSNTMTFRIYSGYGEVIGPSSATELTNNITTSGFNSAWGSIYGIKSVDDITSSNTNAFTIDMSTMSKESIKSVTLLLNTYGTSTLDTHQLEAVFNKTNMGKGTVSDTEEYYLVGNFGDASADVNIDPSDDDSKLKMTPYWYKDGAYSLTAIEDYDSLVYKATVTKPAAGWGEMYMVIVSGTQLDSYESGSDYSWWADVIRPQEQFNVLYWRSDDGGKSYYYRHISGLDATAKHGGLQTAAYNSYWDVLYNTEQAFNPLMSDQTVAYVFSMNFTTSTYNIEYIKSDNKFYIAGPAVATDGTTVGSGWKGSGDSYYALALTYDDDGQYYYYADSAGDEVTISMKSQYGFVFTNNLNFTQTTFTEDGVEPVDLHVGYETSVTNSTSYYDENSYALNSSDGGNGDTQYVNFVSSGSGNSSSFYDSGLDSLKFNLPSGEYTIRLYPSKKVGTSQLSYYVVNDRSYRFYQPSATENKLGTSSAETYNTYKTFYDCHAVVLPDGVDAFYVSAASDATEGETDGSVTITQVEFEKTVEIDGTTYNVLPAYTPVILAKNVSDDISYIQWIKMSYYGDDINYTDDDMVSDNQLVGQLEATKIGVSETVDGSTKYNYLFGYRTRGDGKTYIGFFPPSTDSDTNCAVNTVKLQTSFQVGGESSSGKGLLINFEGATTDSETTAIDTIDAATTDNGAYYTLQGVRIAQPTAKGVYIHNGKKFIVK